jgi:hypothetical protein
MKLFLFEFATCGEKIDDSIAVEGLAMFKSLYYGFKYFFDIHSFVRGEYSQIFSLPAGNWNRIEEWLENSDLFLIIAPEDDGLLYSLTKVGEKYAYNLGSSTNAIEITSDKWKLYKKLKGKVNVPETSKKPLNQPFIVKPRVSCGGEGIGMSKDVPEGYIAQEYIEGINLSVSFIVGDEIIPISVNEQVLAGFRYEGAIVPARLDAAGMNDVIDEAVAAVERIKGLNGYVGVDVVHAEVPYVIEVNARVTTPSVAFDKVYGMSVAEMIYRSLFERLNTPDSFIRYRIVKAKGGMENVFAQAGDYSIVLSEYYEYES